MAAPPNVTTKAMSGKFLLNKSLSDDPDEILRLQGVSWFKRRAVSLFTLGLCIRHTTDETGVEHFDMDQMISGIPAMSENRVLDALEREQDHYIFGLMTSKSRRVLVEEITDKYLKKDWTQDSIDDGVVLTETWSTAGKNSWTWTNTQAWGFITINQERRYVSRITFTSPKKEDGPIHARFVYDYMGPI